MSKRNNSLILSEQRLARLAGIDELLNESDDLSEGPLGIGSKAKQKKKKGKVVRDEKGDPVYKKRWFTRNVDKQEASMNFLGKTLDKIDFLNVLDKTIGMPRVGYKKGHGIPFDKFDESDIKKLTTNVSAVYKEAGASFEKISEAEKNQVKELLDDVKKGDQLAAEILMKIVVRHKGKKKGFDIAAMKKEYGIVGIALLDGDTKYNYGIIGYEPGTDKAVAKVDSFIALNKKNRVLDSKPYPIKPGSPLIGAAEAFIKGLDVDDDLNAAAADVQAKLPNDPRHEQVTVTQGNLVDFVSSHYADEDIQALIDYAAKKPKLQRQVGKKAINAQIYLADLIAFLNGETRGEFNPGDQGKELYVPKLKINEGALPDVGMLRESYLRRRFSLSSLLNEDWEGYFDNLKKLDSSTFNFDEEAEDKDASSKLPSSGAETETFAYLPVGQDNGSEKYVVAFESGKEKIINNIIHFTAESNNVEYKKDSEYFPELRAAYYADTQNKQAAQNPGGGEYYIPFGEATNWELVTIFVGPNLDTEGIPVPHGDIHNQKPKTKEKTDKIIAAYEAYAKMKDIHGNDPKTMQSKESDSNEVEELDGTNNDEEYILVKALGASKPNFRISLPGEAGIIRIDDITAKAGVIYKNINFEGTLKPQAGGDENNPSLKIKRPGERPYELYVAEDQLVANFDLEHNSSELSAKGVILQGIVDSLSEQDIKNPPDKITAQSMTEQLPDGTKFSSVTIELSTPQKVTGMPGSSLDENILNHKTVLSERWSRLAGLI